MGMKSLKESLFDPDLVSQKLPYEKLLKGRISRDDILDFVAGGHDGFFMNIKNRAFRQWCSDFWNREVKSKGADKWDVLCPVYCTWVSYDISQDQEALKWLKPGSIHRGGFAWNDAMYASSLDIRFKWWGTEQQWKNITELNMQTFTHLV